MGWSRWRKLCDEDYLYNEHLDWDGPVCYELALGGPRGGGLEIVYVGESGNARQRLSRHGLERSHLRETIRAYLRQGWCVFCRVQRKESKSEAVRLQNSRLAKYSYPWNIRLAA
jgi:hypothetical protein